MNFTSDKLRKLSDIQLDKLSGAILTEKSRRKRDREKKAVASYAAAHPEIRQAGYNTGRYWDNSWMPGGPFNKLDNPIWQEGFAAGLAENLKANPDYAEWRKAYCQLGGYYRYEGVIK